MANGIDFVVRLPFIAAALASKIGNVNYLKPLSVVVNAIQATILQQSEQDSKKFETSYKMETYFNFANFAITFFTFGCLVNELGKRYSIFNMNLSWSDLGNIVTSDRWNFKHPTWSFGLQNRFGGYGYGVMLLGLIVTTVAVTLLNKTKSSSYEKLKIEDLGSSDPQEQQKLAKTVSLSWDRPLNQSFSQWIYVTQICLNVALTILSPLGIFSILNLALNGYALYKITERKWVSISRTKEWELSSTNPFVKSVTAIYRCFLMPVSPEKQETEPCSVCREEKPTVYFHVEHPFHEKCLIRYVVQNSEPFVSIDKITKKETMDNKGNRSVSYSGEMPKSTKPGCPNCREQPFYNDLEIHVDGLIDGSRQAEITWV